MLTVQCPQCTQVLNLREQHLGVKGRCLHCRVPIVAERCAGLEGVQVRLVEPVENSFSADKAGREVARSEPVKGEVQGGGESLWPGESEVALASIGASLSGSCSHPLSPLVDEGRGESQKESGRSMPNHLEQENPQGKQASEGGEGNESNGNAMSDIAEPEVPQTSSTILEKPEPAAAEPEKSPVDISPTPLADLEAESDSDPCVEAEFGKSSSVIEVDDAASEVPSNSDMAAWSSIIKAPPTRSEPTLFEDAPVVVEENSNERKIEDVDVDGEEELPRAASMVIEAPSWLTESKSGEEAEGETGGQDSDLNLESSSLFERKGAIADDDDRVAPADDGLDFSPSEEPDSISEEGMEVESEGADSLDEPEVETSFRSIDAEREAQNDRTELETQWESKQEEESLSENAIEVLPEVEESTSDAANTDPFSWLKKTAAKAPTENSDDESELSALKESDDDPEAASEGEAGSDATNATVEEPEVESPAWLKKPEAETLTENSDDKSEFSALEEDDDRLKVASEDEDEAGSDPANAMVGESDVNPLTWPKEEPTMELEPEPEPEEAPQEGKTEQFESGPKFGSEFETLANHSDKGTRSPASEWTPFEFPDAEKNSKPISCMNPITPSDVNPSSPFEDSEPTENNAEISEEAMGNEEEMKSLSESDAPSSEAGDALEDAVVGDDSTPQTVKKSALPPLVGMAGVAAFPLAEQDADKKESGPGADLNSIDDGAPEFSETIAVSSAITADSPDAENAAADESSPVADWLAGAKTKGGGSEEPKKSEIETGKKEIEEDSSTDSPVQALAETEEDKADATDEVDNSKESIDPDRADALARFAARIDGPALEKSAEAEESKEESSELGTGLLPWEKVAQEKATAAGEAKKDGVVELKSDDGNVRINPEEEVKEPEDTSVNHEHKSAAKPKEEAELEAQCAPIVMGQANGDGKPLTNVKRERRLKKKRRRRRLLVLFLLLVGGVGALMYFKPGFRPDTLKAGVTTAWKEGKSQFDSGKLTDLQAIVGPLKELWTMQPEGGEKAGEEETPVPSNTAAAQSPETSAAPAPKPAPVSVIPNSQPDIVVSIPQQEKPTTAVVRPVALPDGGEGAHSAGEGDTAGEATDSFTRAAPGETEEQRSARIAGEQVLKDFYGARTAEEKLTFILDPNESASEIEDAYPSPVDAPTIRSMEFKGRLVDSGTQRAFAVFDVRENENGDRHRWCIPEVRSGEFKIDWGLYRQLANDELTRFLADPDSAPTKLRLLLRRGAEVAAEESPWKEPALEMAVLMPLDDGSPSKILMKRSTHDELGLNRDLGDGMARLGNFQLEWLANGSDGEATATIAGIKNWGAWPSAPSSAAAEKETPVTADR
jgi:hypothetical protein